MKWLIYFILSVAANISYASGFQGVKSDMMVANLTGYISDSQSQHPIYGAMLTVEGYPVIYSDISGYYSICVEEGIYDIKCIAFGYQKNTVHDFFISGQVQLDFALIQDICGPPLNLEGELINYEYAFLTWNPTSGNTYPENWIHYDNGSNYTGIGFAEGGSFTVAIRFDTNQLEPYNGYYLTMVRFFPTGENTEYVFKVWTDANASNLLVSIPLTGLIINEWNDLNLGSPVFINPSKELWIGYACINHPPGVYPAGCDSGPAVTGYGDMVTLDGSTWEPLSTYGFDYNLNIQGFILHPGVDHQALSPNKSYTNSLIGYNIYRNNQLLPQSPVTANLFLDGPLPLSSVYIYTVTALYSDCESEETLPVIIWTEDTEEIVGQNTVHIFPNPADDYLYMSSASLVKHVFICTSLGDVVYDRNADDRKIKVDIGGFVKGMYVALIMTETGSFTEKFIVE
jgi:hypothetical protein